MRGMLYDLIHSMWGTISLISGGFLVSSCALYMGLCYFWSRYNTKYNLRKLKKALAKDGHVRKEYSVIFWTVSVFCVLAFAVFLFKDWRAVQQKYNYIHTPMAEQKDVEILFTNEITVEVTENWDEKVYMRKLHIEIESPLPEITEDEIENRIKEFSGIYQAGTKTPAVGIGLDSKTVKAMQETRGEVTEMHATTFTKYQDEFEKWDTLYSYSDLASDLYQSSRCARDMLEVGRSECTNEALLRIAAESVYRGECVLEYGDRNIGEKDNPTIIEAEDMLFYNGKVFYQLYMEAAMREELRIYRKDFIVNAYVCMVLAEEKITKEDIGYAIVNYYIGNIGERMSDEIDQNNPYGKQIAGEALKHYRIALNSLNNRPNYYNKEGNMEKNCETGIKTLNTKLGLEN